MPDAEEGVRAKLFYYITGKSVRELLDTLDDGVSARRTMSAMMALFDRHCNPKVNEQSRGTNFFMSNQGLDESINNYCTDLKMLNGTCNF